MYRKVKLFLVMAVIIFANSSCNQSNTAKLDATNDAIGLFNGSLKVLAINSWQEGTTVDGGFNALANVIKQTDADVVLLSEIRNYNDEIFSEKMIERLKVLGLTFYGYNSQKSPLILSKYPVEHKGIASNSLAKSIVRINDSISIAFYAAHLDYTHYACYLPRGYDGITWQQLAEPVVDIEKILKQNLDSQRDEAIAVFLEDAAKEVNAGNYIILGGDFNEPSHLDWTEETKDKFDHNGTVIPWHTSVTMLNNGFKDAYRVKYPDPDAYPGITWPAYNQHVERSKLLWAAQADERDRIDFIYYYQNDDIHVEEVQIVGPVGSIAYGQPVMTNPGDDPIIQPEGIWPTDHKAVLASFKLY